MNVEPKGCEPHRIEASLCMNIVWHNEAAEVYLPSDLTEKKALEQTTHLAVGAHPDDLEIMCWDGILQCFRRSDKWFTGVTVTNGSGSPRGETYAQFSDAEMVEVRLREQRAAALTGEYSAQVSLMYSSAEAKESKRSQLVDDLVKLLESTRPEVLYTHNLVGCGDSGGGSCPKGLAQAVSVPGMRGLAWPGLDPRLQEGGSGCERSPWSHTLPRRSLRLADHGWQTIRPGHRRAQAGERHLFRRLSIGYGDPLRIRPGYDAFARRSRPELSGLCPLLS